MMESRLPELLEIEKLINKLGDKARVDVLTKVAADGQLFPVYAVSLGPTDRTTPVYAVVGGIHGLERVGTHLSIAYMNAISRMLPWDSLLQGMFEKIRLVFIPLVNPAGMYRKTRSNANGVDLMRNAPVEGEGVDNWKIFAGHRISNRLPWYRGIAGGSMEQESTALCHYVEKHLFPAKFSMMIDLHSGFGARDRLWFPYARSSEPFPNVTEVYSLSKLFRKAYPNHVYLIEPQSHSYTTHGDLWDFLYDTHRKDHPESLFLPLCLEMGAWNWIRKNPWQMARSEGVFNPVKPHREKRTRRRHLPLLEFLLRATYSHENWAWPKQGQFNHYQKKALNLWYSSGNH